MKTKHIDKADRNRQVTQTCPYCQTRAVFLVAGSDIKIAEGFYSGQRVCPNCKGHVFVIFNWDNLFRSYPPFLIDFDSSDIPTQISSAFSEALLCHSHKCYVAAAIMIRRTLEEICDDRTATGKDLKARIGSLRDKVTLPEELFLAMDELRLLGNDAAHIESKSYTDIGDTELEAAIAFTKEILKSVYQYKGLLDKLRSLKKANTTEQRATANP
jgi:hypothetical protein